MCSSPSLALTNGWSGLLAVRLQFRRFCTRSARSSQPSATLRSRRLSAGPVTRSAISITRRAKDGRKPGDGQRMPGAGLSWTPCWEGPVRKASLPAVPGKLAVRNDRGDRGNVGIIRSPVRASILPGDYSDRRRLGTRALGPRDRSFRAVLVPFQPALFTVSRRPLLGGRGCRGCGE